MEAILVCGIDHSLPDPLGQQPLNKMSHSSLPQRLFPFFLANVTFGMQYPLPPRPSASSAIVYSIRDIKKGCMQHGGRGDVMSDS